VTGMATLHTTLGERQAGELGVVLPHEHVFVDLRLPGVAGHGAAEVADVVRLMAPEIGRARAAGVTALVECTPVGVGRRVDMVRAVSDATGFPIVVPTGIYREPWVPDWAHAAGESELEAWMKRELDEEIEATGVRAAWIKLSAGDDGITPVEAKILRAAARAAAATGAVIGSHTIRGRVVLDQLAIIEAEGHSASRFIAIHAQAEKDFGLNLEVARRGAFVEYDWIGLIESDDFYVDRVLRLLDAGFGGQILLSQDRGWFDPAKPGGGEPKPYTYLFETFLPKLEAAGVGAATIRAIMADNPFRAYAR
jgi:phosphotriesterase-related protein